MFASQPSTYKVQFFGKSVEVHHLLDEKEFDCMMAPFEVSSLEEQTADTPPDSEEPVFHCWGRKAETGPTSFKVLEA